MVNAYAGAPLRIEPGRRSGHRGTAIELVFRTPGFDPEESDGGRGLSGVRSNPLIDGERPPPKGQSAEQRLREMPIGRIERIDAGARLDLDMQGCAQVLNVVTMSNPPAYYEVTAAVQREGTGDQRQEQRAKLRGRGHRLVLLDFEDLGSGLDPASETFTDEETDHDIAAEYRRPLGETGTLMVALVDAQSTEQSEESFASSDLFSGPAARRPARLPRARARRASRRERA